MRSLIVDKIIKMEKHLQEIKEYKPKSYPEYINNKPKKYAIERLIQIIVELALNINNIIIKDEGEYPAKDYYNSFIKLVELDILQENFSYNIASSTGIRNRLVYEYEKIDNQIVYESIDRLCEYYTKYIKEINSYLG